MKLRQALLEGAGGAGASPRCRAARAFAARVLVEASGSAEERVKWIYRQALGRAPTAEESETLVQLHELHRGRYADDPVSAEALISVGELPTPENLDAVELAAWTSVTRVVLNLHETITRN